MHSCSWEFLDFPYFYVISRITLLFVHAKIIHVDFSTNMLQGYTFLLLDQESFCISWVNMVKYAGLVFAH